MNRYVIASLLLFTLLIGLAVFLFSDKDAPVHEKEAAPVEKKAAAVAKVAIPKTIKYRVEVTNPTNRVINDIPIYIAVPVDSSRQQIVKTVISEKHEILDDEAGNRTAKINLPALVPYK